jgi:hypothetical protein
MPRSKPVLTVFTLFAITFGVNVTTIDASKLDNITTLNEVIKIETPKANAAATSVDVNFIGGTTLKTLRKKWSKKVPWADLFDIFKDINRDDSVPIAKDIKFISPDSAHVEWNDAFRDCDVVGSKLILWNNSKSCLSFAIVIALNIKA